jgi:hypothetical protein
MSTYTYNTQKLFTNTNENNLTSNEQSYDNLINVCALRKQFSRIIPSYYTEIQKQGLKIKRQNISSIEEYKKLQEEIDMIQESIELLKEKKQKKLKEIENLRSLMRKVGNKKMTKEDKKQINIINNNINNYCEREKSTNDLCFGCKERKGSNGFKVYSDEGLSLAPTLSGLSSGKDDDLGGEEGLPINKYPDNCNNFISGKNSSSSSLCFEYDDDSNRKAYVDNPARSMRMQMELQQPSASASTVSN